MAYRARPRFQASIEPSRPPDKNFAEPHHKNFAPQPEGRVEPHPVLSALSEMLNAPPDNQFARQRQRRAS